MSKIDLSKAKVGDKFMTREGYVVELKDTVLYFGDYVYRLTSPNAFVCVFQDGRMYKCNKASEFDLVEQVFDDEKDTIDREIVEAMNQAIKEIPEKKQLREQELQRRQEVVELAEKLFTEKYLQEWYQYLIDNNTTKTDYVTYIFEWSEKFVNAKDKYLKEGKL